MPMKKPQKTKKTIEYLMLPIKTAHCVSYHCKTATAYVFVDACKKMKFVLCSAP